MPVRCSEEKEEPEPMKITFDHLMNLLGCKDGTYRHVVLSSIPCPYCNLVMGSKVYNNAGRPLYDLGGQCGMVKFVIAGRAFWACFEKVQCQGCGKKFLYRFVTKLWCDECEIDVRIGMKMFDTHYICGQSHHPSCFDCSESKLGTVLVLPVETT